MCDEKLTGKTVTIFLKTRIICTKRERLQILVFDWVFFLIYVVFEPKPEISVHSILGLCQVNVFVVLKYYGTVSAADDHLHDSPGNIPKAAQK